MQATDYRLSLVLETTERALCVRTGNTQFHKSCGVQSGCFGLWRKDQIRLPSNTCDYRDTGKNVPGCMMISKCCIPFFKSKLTECPALRSNSA